MGESDVTGHGVGGTGADGPEADEPQRRLPWVELAFAGAGILALRWTGRWPTAAFAGVAAGASLLAAGSLRAAAYVIRKAAGFQGFDADENGRQGASVTRILAERFRGATASLVKIPGRTRFALELAVYWAGVAAALIFFVEYAAGAGWAASAAGLTAARLVRRGSRLRPLVFTLAALPAATLSLLWVRPAESFMMAHAVSATLVMAGGGCLSGASVVALRWRVSEKLSVPAGVAFSVWWLTWFFVQGADLGHEPAIVAWGAGVAAGLSGLGFLLCALDGAAAAVVLFFVGRVYAFLDWTATLPFILAMVVGWRPSLPWRRAEAGRTRHGAAFEITTGVVPVALAAGYFTFASPVFLGAYAAYCAAIVAVRVSRLAARLRRAKVALAAGSALLLPAAPLAHHAAGYGFRLAGAAAVGALLAWALDRLLDARAEDWRRLPVPVRHATLGGVAAALAAGLAALAIAVGAPHG